MHEYRRFIQEHLDGLGWKQSELARASGLSRQLIHSILSDDRDHLGQMPDDSTLEGIAQGFSVPVERVRTAAARSLVGYTDDGAALTPNLQDVHIDALLNEIRRRVNELSANQATPAGASGEASKDKEARKSAAEQAKNRRGRKLSDIKGTKDSRVNGRPEGDGRENLPGGEVG